MVKFDWIDFDGVRARFCSVVFGADERAHDVFAVQLSDGRVFYGDFELTPKCGDTRYDIEFTSSPRLGDYVQRYGLFCSYRTRTLKGVPRSMRQYRGYGADEKQTRLMLRHALQRRMPESAAWRLAAIFDVDCHVLASVESAPQVAAERHRQA